MTIEELAIMITFENVMNIVFMFFLWHILMEDKKHEQN